MPLRVPLLLISWMMDMFDICLFNSPELIRSIRESHWSLDE